MVKCEDNIQCMFEIDICNRHPVCKDGSDEDPQVCTKGKQSKYVSLRCIDGWWGYTAVCTHRQCPSNYDF